MFKRISAYLKFHFIPGYRAWRITWYLFLGYSIFLLIMGFSTNFKNNKLEKVTGIIEDFNYYTMPVNHRIYHNFNLKLESDENIYGQSWKYYNNKLAQWMLISNINYTPQKGDTIEFYRYRKPTAYNYIFFIEKNPKNNKEEYCFRKVKQGEFVHAIEGMKVNGKTILDFHKRWFTTNSFYILMIGEWIILGALAVMFTSHVITGIWRQESNKEKSANHQPSGLYKKIVVVISVHLFMVITVYVVSSLLKSETRVLYILLFLPGIISTAFCFSDTIRNLPYTPMPMRLIKTVGITIFFLIHILITYCYTMAIVTSTGMNQ